LKHIHFIINPIAGKGKNSLSMSILKKYFKEDEYAVILKHSQHKKHAIELTQESMAQKAEIIVACGGDGTINEVASCLVGTSIILGIIRIGSGNGLASNLKIPKDLDKALLLIKSQLVKKIDVGSLNNHYFFSNTGFGFSARVVKNYEQSKTRKFSSYVKASLKSLREIEYNNDIEIKLNDQTILANPLMIFISNSNELGYKMSLTPRASLQDGLLDVLIVTKLNTYKIFIFSILALFKKHHILKEVKNYQTKQIKLSQTKKLPFYSQIDGEILELKDDIINLSVLEKSLNVIAN
jgi:diacylglycerol kinase (ATP)